MLRRFRLPDRILFGDVKHLILAAGGRFTRRRSTMTDPSVEYNFLGGSGVKVSNICLGTMTFGNHPEWYLNSPSHPSEETAHEIMDTYAKLGGNFIDTANIYSMGKSEEIVGRWLAKQNRKRFVVATKVRFTMDYSNPNGTGLSRRHIIESCEQSLERLQTNYIDLLQMHCWDAGTPINEILRTFDDLIRSGKVRYFGASNLCGWQAQKMVDKLEALGMDPCISLQQQYSLLCRQPELEEFVVCKNEGLGVLTWGPLKGGLLTGKYKRDTTPATDCRLGFGHEQKIDYADVPSWQRFTKDDKYWTLIDLMKAIADKHEKTMAQVALRWLLQKNIVASVIVGATSVKQLQENMGAAKGWKLSAEEMSQLDAASKPGTPYPYDMILEENEERYNRFNIKT